MFLDTALTDSHLFSHSSAGLAPSRGGWVPPAGEHRQDGPRCAAHRPGQPRSQSIIVSCKQLLRWINTCHTATAQTMKAAVEKKKHLIPVQPKDFCCVCSAIILSLVVSALKIPFKQLPGSLPALSLQAVWHWRASSSTGWQMINSHSVNSGEDHP